MATPPGDSSAAAPDSADVMRALHTHLQISDARINGVEEASRVFGETQKQMDNKLDGIYQLLIQFTSGSEFGSAQKAQQHHTTSPSPPPHTSHTILSPFTDSTNTSTYTTNTLAFNTSNRQPTTTPGFVYTLTNPDTTQNKKTQIPLPNDHTLEIPRQQPNRNTQPQFNLSIARPKLDFPTFSGEEPFNWLRQCEKYFSLASVPMDNWVPLATLYCNGIPQTWWRSLRTPTTYVLWAQFCNMVTNRFSQHSTHSSLEAFHNLKQNSSVTEYINKFEEMMGLTQMDYPGLNEQYFVSSFIAGLREGIKHYIIPHNPQNLCETYWKAKELEKGILVKKSLITSTSTYTKPAHISITSYAHKSPTLPQPVPLPKPPPPQNNQPPPPKPQQFKNKESGKCWGCQEPWTPEHKFVCKFRKAVHAMAIDPKNWLVAEQMMEDDNHVLLHAETTEETLQQ
jgi:hypothetical protein